MLRGSGVMTVVCAAVAALVAPAVATAARPAVTTGAVAAVSQNSVQLSGTVDPNGKATRFYFEYGPTTAYGAVSDGNPAPRIGRAAGVLATVGGLQPFTRYHYRIVAFNADGQRRGRDRTFRTLRVPLALSLAATPNPVIAGRAVTLSGTLGGTGNAGRRIRLRSNPFPYLGGFNPVGNSVVTDPVGGFSFALLSLPVTTQFQVQIEAAPEIASAVVTVGAAVRVSTGTERRRVARGVSVRFAGTDPPGARRRARRDPEAREGRVADGQADDGAPRHRGVLALRQALPDPQARRVPRGGQQRRPVRGQRRPRDPHPAAPLSRGAGRASPAGDGASAPPGRARRAPHPRRGRPHAALDGLDQRRPQRRGRDDAVDRPDLDRALHGVDGVELGGQPAELLRAHLRPQRGRARRAGAGARRRSARGDAARRAPATRASSRVRTSTSRANTTAAAGAPPITDACAPSSAIVSSAR